jgi:hypothetical protein
MTKVHGQRIMDMDLQFDNRTISFTGKAGAALINTLAMILVILSSAFNLFSSEREITSPSGIAVLIIAIIAMLIALLSAIKYLKFKKQNLFRFSTTDIEAVEIQKKSKSLKVSFKLLNKSTYKISCVQDRYSGRLVQFLKDSNVNVIYR